MERYKQEPLGTMPKYIEDYIRSCDLESTDVPAMSPDAQVVSDHRGSNSQSIDFEGVEIYSIFTAKIENTEKSIT